jgi:hypothetical protein
MISWHTTTPSCPSSHPHGAIHIISPLSHNWTTHPAPLPLNPSLLALHQPLSRAPWNPTQSPGKPFTSTRHTQLLLWKDTRHNHAMIRDRRTALHSASFGHSHSRDRSVTPHQHHAASHKHLRTMWCSSRGDVSCFRRSRRKPPHKSMLRFYSTFLFFSFIFFSSLSRAY